MNDSNYAYTSASSSWFMSNAQIQSSSSYWIGNYTGAGGNVDSNEVFSAVFR